jgi:hypothetical protein
MPRLTVQADLTFMNGAESYPRLTPLHPDTSLNCVKLSAIGKLSTERLLASLVPGQKDCLKTRADGTILDGHHRIYVLRARGVDVDRLPREVMEKS